MESIRTTIIITANNPKKAFKFIDKMIKKGFSHDSTQVIEPKFLEARYSMQLSKLEQFTSKS